MLPNDSLGLNRYFRQKKSNYQSLLDLIPVSLVLQQRVQGLDDVLTQHACLVFRLLLKTK
jgi:hypothetical protein